MLEQQYDKYSQFYRKFGDPSERLNASYDSWLQDMASRPGAELVPFEFDLEKYPEQDIYFPKIEGYDKYSRLPDFMFYAGLNATISRSLGFIACQKLIGKIKDQPTSAEESTPLLKRLANDQREGKNTMFVTSHFTFPELGLFKALRFYSKRDRQRINMGGILMNKLMARQAYKGKKLTDQFAPIADIYFSYPKSASAEKHNVPNDIMMLGNALLMKELKSSLKTGGLELDVALTGKQITPIKNEGGDIDHYEMPPIDPASVNLMSYFDNVLGATLIKSPITNEWVMNIGDLIDIKESTKTNTLDNIVGNVYDGIATSIEKVTHKEVDMNNFRSKIGKLAINK